MSGDDPTDTEKPKPRLGSYRLVQPLGSGGMSSVFRAEHAETGVEVALKILPRNLARNKTLLQRFMREAKSAEALEHPNIVAIYDHGVDNGQYYLVLEYVAGGDLHDWVRKNGPMPLADAIGVIRSVAEGLKFAAQQGLIHRDIKPANLLRTATGTVKIADLGLALQAEAEDERVTRVGTTVGTVDYMSPEQARDSRGTSERSDIYSLGCTLFFLLTGQPPFPGGDVTEKLTRHFTAAPPDPCELRPELPAECAQLVRKMMAKKTDHRHANYDELIAALAAFPVNSSSAPSPAGVLDALFDDDDAPIPVDGSIPLKSPPPTAEPVPLYAIVDDEDDEEEPESDAFLPFDLSEATDDPEPDEDRPRMADVSMAELAAMVEDDDRENRGRRIERPAPNRPPIATPAPVIKPTRFEEPEEEAIEGAMPAKVSFGSGLSMTAEERSWLKALVIGGVGLIVAVIAFHQLYRATVNDTAPPVDAATTDEPAPILPETIAPVPVVPPPIDAPPSKKSAPGLAVTPPRSFEANGPRPKPVVTIPTGVWVEPVDLPRVVAAESEFGPALESRFRPSSGLLEVPAPLPGKVVSVRRLPDPKDPDQKPTLSAALDAVGNENVELVDDGPFFENDIRLAGETHWIRARPGFRPVICLRGPRFEVAREQTALIDVGSRTLVLNGLDLIVDAKELPRGIGSIFNCRGGSLTLRDCTITVHNQGGLPISVVRAGASDKASRVRIERTLIRGSFTTAIELAAGGAEAFISRSVVLNGLATAVTFSEPTGAFGGRVHIIRSVVATRGPSFEISAQRHGPRSKPVSLRALGSTFAHLAAPAPTSLIHAADETSDVNNLVNWDGESNAFAGWSDWLSAGKARSVRVPNLAEARAQWPGTDSLSLESPEIRKFAMTADRAVPASLGELAPERPDVLQGVAVPTPWLQEKTIEPFPRPVVPGLTDSGGNLRAVPVVIPAGDVSVASKGVRELNFDTEAMPYVGDLGRFLASEVRADDVLVRVKVTGLSPHVWTPVRLPDGVSLEVVVTQTTGGRSPSWSPPRNSTGDALLEVRGGSLVLMGVNLTRDGSAGLKHLIRVEGGHLVLVRTGLVSRGATEPRGGGLIAFDSPGSKPVKLLSGHRIPWPFEVAVDRPTCRVTESLLMTEGDAISATLGRGIVALSQCAITAGTTAFSLNPGRVARDRFEADLWLDHCTVASERVFVALGPWPGSSPGPDRPWLVSTNRTAFFGTYERRTQESVLLRANSDGFARGTLFWQGLSDAFEVSHFLASGGAALNSNQRADVTRQWVDVWGPAHVRGATGPHLPGGAMSRRLVNRQLKPGDLTAGDLFIDPAFPKDDPPRDLGVDLVRLGVKPTARVLRPR